MNQLVNVNFDLAVEVCWVCGISFAIPQTFRNRKKTHGGSFYCPAGCHLGYGDSELDKAKKEIERIRKEKEWAEQRALSNHRLYESEQKSKAVVRGHLTRVKNRIANGVCPCCNRSFKNLHRHMKSQHPTFTED